MADFEKQVSLIEVDVKTVEAKKQVEDLTRSIIDQNNSVKNNTTQIKQLEKANKELQGEVAKGNKTQKEANSERKKNLKEINKMKVGSAALKDGIKDLNKERQNAVKVTKLQSNSLNALRKRSVDLKKSLNDQETATKSGAKEFKRLQGDLKGTNEKIKELDTGAGDFKTTIGDYPQALDGMTGGLGSAAKGMGALIKQSLLFLATPLGLVIGAVALAVIAVKTAFTGSEEGQNKWNKIMGVIGVTIGNLSDLLLALGEFIIEAFENPQQSIEDFAELIKQNIINRFEGLMELIPALGKAITQLFAGDFAEAAKTAGNALVKVATGIDDITGKLEAATKATKDFFDVNMEESARAAKVADDRAKADILARSLLVDRAKIESKIAELRLKSRLEGTLSAEIRKEALIEAQGLEEDLLKREKEVLQLRADAITAENSFSKSTKENKDAEAAAIAAVSQIEATRFNQQRTTQRELNRLNKEIEADNNRTTKETEKRQEKLNSKLKELAEFRLNEERNEALLSAETDQEKFEMKRGIAQEDFDLRMEDLEAQEEILKETEFETADERATAQADIDLQKEQAEATHRGLLLGINTDADKVQAKASEKADKARLKKEKAVQDEFKSLNQKGRQAITNIFAIQSNLVEKRFRKRQSSLRRQLEVGLISEEQFAKKSEDIEKEKATALFKIQLKAFKLQKAIDLVTAGVQVALGISRALALTAPASFILAGITGTLGAVQIAAIASKQPPQAPSFAQGGDVFGTKIKGKSHAQGGEDIHVGGRLVANMQGDEGLFVTKKEATNPALMMLDQMNTMHGGNSMFSSSGRFLQQGGEANTDISATEQAALLAAAVSEMPAPVVDVRSVMAGINAEVEATEVGTI